ncbi:MAG: ArsR/SmtB family transcription factor [Acidiferrobacterales bacterium]
MENKLAAASLSALGHPSRLAVFRALVQAGPSGLAAGKVSELTGIAPSSLSFHFKELAHAGLVSARQEGRYVIYAARFEVMNDLLAYLTESCCGGNPCSPVSSTACDIALPPATTGDDSA